MNTKISFLYRDAANYKVYNECIIKGEISQEQISIIAESLMDGTFFKPDMVGLPGKTFADLGYRPYDDDPEFFELGVDGDLEGSFEWTDAPSNVDLTVDQLTRNFILASNHGWLAVDEPQTTEADSLTLGGI